MTVLFLDIETLPGDEALKRDVESQIKPPGSMSKPETLKKWEEEQKSQEVERRYRGTALRGHQGRILCIGCIKETPGGASEKVIVGEESAILREFWETATDVDLFVGFNVLEFDLKFIMQRSIVAGVQPTKQLNFARYRSDSIYDVMAEWELWGRDMISLDALARALGIESPKGDVDGSKVYDYYLAGRLDEIYAYCLKDVMTTREIYRRMNFLQ